MLLTSISLDKISISSVERKPFLSVIATQLIKYITSNRYLDRSAQKISAGRKDLEVVWLNLAGACATVPRKMIQLLLEMYHIQKNIKKILEKSFSWFHKMILQKGFYNKLD